MTMMALRIGENYVFMDYDEAGIVFKSSASTMTFEPEDIPKIHEFMGEWLKENPPRPRPFNGGRDMSEDIDSAMVIKHLREIQVDYENRAYTNAEMVGRFSITINNAIILIERGDILEGQLEAAESLMEFNDD